MTQRTSIAARIITGRQILNRIFTIKPKTSRSGPIGFRVVAARAAPTVICTGRRAKKASLSAPESRPGWAGRKPRARRTGPPTQVFRSTSRAPGWWRTRRAIVERDARMGTGAARAGRRRPRSAPSQGGAARRAIGAGVAALAHPTGPSRAAQARDRADRGRSPRRGAFSAPSAAGNSTRSRRNMAASGIGSPARSGSASEWSRFPARRT